MVRYGRPALGAPLASGRLPAPAARRAQPRLDQLAALHRRPGAARHSDETIRKILGENVLRVARANFAG